VPPRKVDLRKPMQSTKAASVKKVDLPASKSTVQHDGNKLSSKPSEQQQHKPADTKSNKQAKRLSDGQVLEGYINRKDRQGMQTALQHILKVGGADMVADAFVVLESMRYNPEELQRWITQGGEVPVKTNPGKSNVGGSRQTPRAPQSEWSPVEDALDKLKNLRHSAGEWLDFSKHVSRNQIKTMLDSSNGLDESDVDSKLPYKDAQALDKYLKASDIRSTKRLMKDMLIDGGLSRVESALGELQTLGYDPVKVQKLLEGDVSSPIKSRVGAEREEQLSNEISETEDVSNPIQPKRQAERKEQFSNDFGEEDDMPSFLKQEKDDMPSFHKPERAAEHKEKLSKEILEDEELSSPAQMPAKNEPSMVDQVKTTNQAQIDAQILEGDLMGADRDGMKQAVALLNGEGGRERVQAALGQLNVMGYNPSSVQDWLAGTEHTPVKRSKEEQAEKKSNKSEEPLSVHDKSETQPAADEEDVDASLVLLLKKASVVQAKQLKAPHSVTHTALRVASP